MTASETSQKVSQGGCEATSESESVTILVRVTRGVEYIKIVLLGGRVVGALLIGDTDLEETFENLICNEILVGDMNLLDPTVDIEDFFD